jgi:DNA topoisomerase-3
MKRTPAATESSVEEALRTWRLFEARRRGLPAFRIFSDETLRAIAQRRPAKAAELLAVPGIGISTVEKYGRQIYGICQTPEEGQT